MPGITEEPEIDNERPTEAKAEKDSEGPATNETNGDQPKNPEGPELADEMMDRVAKFSVYVAVGYVVSLLLVAIGLIGTAATLGPGVHDGQYVILKPTAPDNETQGIFRTYRVVERDYQRWDVDIGAVDFGQADVAGGHAEASVQAGADAGVEKTIALNGFISNVTSGDGVSKEKFASAFKKGTGVSTNEGDVYAYVDDEVAEFENISGKLAVMVLAFLILKTFATCEFLQKLVEFYANNYSFEKENMYKNSRAQREKEQKEAEIKFMKAIKIWRVKDLILSSQFMGPSDGLACAAAGGLIDVCQGLACSWLPNVYVFPLSSIKPDDKFINLASFQFDDDRLFYICAGFAYFTAVAISLAVFDKAVVVFQRRATTEGDKECDMETGKQGNEENMKQGMRHEDYHMETGGCLLGRCTRDAHKRGTEGSQKKRVWPLLVLRLMMCMLRLSLLACLAAVVACFVYYMQFGFKMVLAFDFSLYGTLSVRHNLVAWSCVLRFMLPLIILVDFCLLCVRFGYAFWQGIKFLWVYLPCSKEDSGPRETHSSERPQQSGSGAA